MAALSAQPIPTIIYGCLGDVHPPGGYILLHFWQLLAGDSEWALRFPSAVFGALLLLPVLLSTRRLWKDKTFIWAGLAFIASPYSVYLSQETRTYAYIGFFCAWALYFAIAARQEKRLWQYLGFVLSSLAALWCHHLSAGLIAGLGIYIVIGELNTEKKRWWWVAPLGSFLIILFLYLPQMLVTLGQIRMFAEELKDVQVGGLTAGSFIKCLGGAFFHLGSGFYFTTVDAHSFPMILSNLINSVLFFLFMSLPFFILFYGLWKWWRDDIEKRWLILLLLILPALIVAATVSSARHFVPVLPAYILGTGWGLAMLWKKHWGKVLVVLLLLINCFILIDYYARPIMPTQHRYIRNFREAGQYILQNEKPGDSVYLHLDHYSYLNTEYYLRGTQCVIKGYYEKYHFEHIPHNQLLDYINRVELFAALDDLLNSGHDVWFVANDPRSLTPSLPISGNTLSVGTDSDEVFDRRLCKFSTHYPKASVVSSPGDILRIIHIPHKVSN